ncbi:protein XRP2-like isoform X2 [Gouania willdenowi]|uniref:Protein XRP2-like n=2 Tax=Gouania willdenowi TaxID=441366 RepID=A0A8C5DSW1_GOUWI|nr:protein XRP2-like isoform X2 [Gouania willdenowi]XP_028311261.1 protein XRP2-like isoform X2 [Gouania willdenowi]
MAPLNKAAHLMMGPPPDSHSQLHYNRDSQDSSSGPRLVASPHVNLVTPRGRFPFPHSARRPIFFIAEYGPQRCMATPQQCPVPAGPHDGMDAPPPPREVPPPPQIPAHPAPLPDPIPTNKGVDTKEVEEDTPLPPSSTSNGGAQVESEKLTVCSHAPHQLEPPLEKEELNASAPPTREQCGISNLSNEFVTKTSEEISKHVVLLTHLTHCKVRLFGSPSTVHLKHIEDCEILCGPVASSFLIDHCTNSTLAFPCQQLRIHNTTNTQVYVHVTSRAIVENCSGVGFAPFTWSYPRLEEDFSLSGLDKDRNNWNQVDDCNWLVTGTPSPNWTVIPEGERKNNWDPPPPQIPAHPAPLPDPIPTNKGVDTKEVEEDTHLPPSSTSNGGAQVESEMVTVRKRGGCNYAWFIHF